MIVIAIIAILMSYAIPAYRNYLVRAKAGEGLSVSSSIKATISEAWVAAEPIAAMNSGAGAIPPAASVTGNYVAQVEVNAGVITATFNAIDPTLSGNTITLTPSDAGGSLEWQCTSTLDDEYLPGECRAVAAP